MYIYIYIYTCGGDYGRVAREWKYSCRDVEFGALGMVTDALRVYSNIALKMQISHCSIRMP